MSDDFSLVNVALVLPDDTRATAIRVSKELSEFASTEFVLGNGTIPHVTLYAVEYPGANIERVIRAVEEIASRHPLVLCSTAEMSANRGYLTQRIEALRGIKGLHARVVTALNPLREEHIREAYGEYREAYLREPQKRRTGIKRYGSPSCFELYQPHLTLTRFSNPYDAVRLQHTKGVLMFNSPSIGVFEQGMHGTCVNQLAEFTLSRA